jgi:aspartate aminotransferase-like enzyme
MLSETYDVWVNPNGDAMADTLLRVGHFGDLSVADNATLANLIEKILSKSKSMD